MSGPTHWTLVEAAEAVAARRISAVELTRACLARIERLQPQLNCFIAVDGDAALEAAGAADAALAAGGRGGAPCPLHGVPLAHKDMFYRAGRVSTCGSGILRETPAPHTATVLERLDAAGALELGRLNMAEFALGPTGHNAHFGPCRNPWHPEHVTGGSSSGSGSAVAARLVFGALGSDTGGSVRIPAGFCGLAGLKPTQGRVSRRGLMPLSFSLDQGGPLARTVRDCARLLRVIAGPDRADPTATAEPVPDYEATLEHGLRGLRVGVPREYFEETATDEVRAALGAAREVLRGLGCELREVSLPEIGRLQDVANVIQSAEGAAVHRRWLAERPQDYSPQVRRRLEPGLLIPAVRYLDALALRGVLVERVLGEVFAQVDVLHVPTATLPAPTIAETDVGAGSGFRELLAEIARCTRPINLLGLPALSVPMGFSAAGLPLGFQLVGRPFAEGLLLNLGHLYQRETDWHMRAPSL
jgi:aspartyl-tRNA(Asn)/glutamyl-tRNA(Gln) amidotransferase subunit A